MNPVSVSRVSFVDMAKGLCIIMVVMMHSTLGVEKAAGSEGWLGYVVAFASPFRMPDFFLLSGLFMAAVIDRDARLYYDRKVVHFIYFYVLWNTIQFAIKVLPGLWGQPALTIAVEYVAMLAYAPIGIMWFLYILALFFVVARLFRGAPLLLLALSVPLHLGHGSIVALTLPLIGDMPSYLLGEFASRLVFFVTGWVAAPLVFRLAETVLAKPRVALGVIAVWALFNGAMVASGVSDHWLATLPLGLMGSMAVIAVGALLTRVGWAGFIAYCGQNSIVIFLAFFLPMAVLRSGLLKVESLLDVGTISALVTIGALTLPLGLKWAIDRTGWGRFLFDRPALFTLASKPTARTRKLAAAE